MEKAVNSLGLKRQAIIEHLLKYASTKINKSKDKDFLIFLQEYYSNFYLADITDKSNEYLFGAALSHWRLAQQRQPGEKKVNIFNPTIAHSGWDSPHTVINVVIDDLPF